MRIGIDVDNTITTTIPLLKEYARMYNEKFVKRGLMMNEAGFTSSNLYEWTKEEEMDFCHKYLDHLIMKVEVKKNAKNIIKKLKDDGNYIYIMTARSDTHFKDPFNQLKKYLQEKGIVYDELIVGCGDKLKFCLDNKIDIMIDDEPHNIKNISPYIPVIAFKGLQNEGIDGNNIYKIDEWKEVYNIINNINEK